MSDRWIVIPNWDGPTGFQHYKDRTPRWIKTYVELMSDDNYLGLSGHRRAILHGLWMEYASSRRRLRVDTVSLSRRLNLRVTTADLEALNHAGWITFLASEPLAEPEQPASPEVEKKEKNLRAVTSQETHDHDDEPDLGTNGTAPASHIRETVEQSLASARGAKR